MRGPWEFESPLCREVDNELFFPDTGQAQQAREAASICASCIHKTECGEWGINNESFGIWGGLSETDRRWMRQRKGIIVRENFFA